MSHPPRRRGVASIQVVLAFTAVVIPLVALTPAALRMITIHHGRLARVITLATPTLAPPAPGPISENTRHE